MKIAVTSTGPTLDDHVATEFDHSKYLLVVDCETMEYEATISPVVTDTGPATGRLFAEQLLQANVSKVLASHVRFGVLKAFLRSLHGTGIQIVDGMNGSVRSVVRQFKEMCMAETVVISSDDILG
jgi:predicted Fe-Mo cluster-binding NifX family protein